MQADQTSSKPLVLGKQLIQPGQETVVKLDIGRLHSDTRITISLFVYRSKQPGPTLLVMAGLHGDEINGIEVVRRSIESGIFKQPLHGTLIAIPVVNIFGFINFSRDNADGKDVNRHFPGSKSGSLASQIAHVIAQQVLPNVHAVIDFHTGAASRYNYPQVRYSQGSPESKDLAMLFHPRFLVQKDVISGSLRKVARDAKVPLVVYEGGEALRFDQFAIETGVEGLKRMLQSMGFAAHTEPVAPSDETIHIEKSLWIRASRAGMFTATRFAGDFVDKGEELGVITDPYAFKSKPVLASKKGYLLGHSNTAIVSQGDPIFHIGYEYSTLHQSLR